MENPRSLDNPNLKRGPRPSKACPAQGLPNCHEELWPRQQNDLIRFHRRTFRDILSVSLKGASFKYEQLHKYYRHLQHICIILYIYIYSLYIYIYRTHIPSSHPWKGQSNWSSCNMKWRPFVQSMSSPCPPVASAKSDQRCGSWGHAGWAPTMAGWWLSLPIMSFW